MAPPYRRPPAGPPPRVAADPPAFLASLRAHGAPQRRQKGGPPVAGARSAAMAAVPALPDRGVVVASAERLAPWIRRTPVVEVDPADLGLAGRRAPLVLKLEMLQH